jgi:hypothetical protein
MKQWSEMRLQKEYQFPIQMVQRPAISYQKEQPLEYKKGTAARHEVAKGTAIIKYKWNSGQQLR